MLYKGESVKHNRKAEWGIGKIVEVDRCGTIRVIFGTKELSIAKATKYLTKVDNSGKE